jgi:hypothetical protein
VPIRQQSTENNEIGICQAGLDTKTCGTQLFGWVPHIYRSANYCTKSQSQYASISMQSMFDTEKIEKSGFYK